MSLTLANSKKMLSDAVKANMSMFSILDRIGLIADVFDAAILGNSSTTGALQVASSFSAEESGHVLPSLKKNLQDVLSNWVNEPKKVTDKIKSIYCSTFSPKASKVGFGQNTTDGFEFQAKQALIIEVAGYCGDAFTVKQSMDKFDDALSVNSSIASLQLRKSIIQTVISNSNSSVPFFKAIDALKANGTSKEYREIVVKSIGASNNLTLIDHLLDNVIFDSSIIQLSETGTLIISVYCSPLKKEVVPKVWPWFTKNWDKISGYVTADTSSIGDVINLFAPIFLSGVGDDFIKTADDWIQGVHLTNDTQKAEWKTKNLFYQDSFERYLDKAKRNTAWLKRGRAEVEEWANQV